MASRKKGGARRVGTVKGSALNRRRGRKSTGSDRNMFFRESARANAEDAGKARKGSARQKALSAASKAESKSGG